MKFSDADGLRVGLWGAGRETASFAAAAARHLPRCQLAVVATDAPATAEERERMPAGAAFVCGEQAVEALAACDLVVRSPGISIHRPEHAALVARGVTVTTATSLWLAEQAGRAVVGVTGTKGKSTTASLIAHLLRAAGASAELAGNVGRPVLELLDRPAPDYYVVELSSFQISDLAAGPRVAVFTNLYREHLDWHGSAERYAADKLRLARLEEVETVVANARDPRLAGLFELPKRVLAFGRAPGFEPSAEGIVREGATVIPAERVPLLGTHNLLNVCAALAALEALGVELPDPAAALEGFEPLPHRLEPVAGTPGPALWVNDSISTTPESTMAALEAFRGRPLIVIAGGFDRRQDYGELGRALAESARVVIGVPDTGGRIVQAVREAGASDCRTYEAADLAEAVAIAARHAGPDSVVLLSPAAPSFGAYRDFEARGRHFRELALASGG